jgi:hypothetical protein
MKGNALNKLEPHDVSNIIYSSMVSKNESNIYNQIKKSRITTYYCCNEYFCDFSDAIKDIMKYKDPELDTILNNEEKFLVVNTISQKINENINTFTPGKYSGLYFYFYDTPLLYMKNMESYKLSPENRKIACIDVDRMFYQSYSIVRNRTMLDLGRNILFVSGVSSACFSAFFLARGRWRPSLYLAGTGVIMGSLSFFLETNWNIKN